MLASATLFRAAVHAPPAGATTKIVKETNALLSKCARSDCRNNGRKKKLRHAYVMV
jgi:hypothetical protein